MVPLKQGTTLVTATNIRLDIAFQRYVMMMVMMIMMMIPTSVPIRQDWYFVFRMSPRRTYILTEVVRGFTLCLQANARMVSATNNRFGLLWSLKDMQPQLTTVSLVYLQRVTKQRGNLKIAILIAKLWHVQRLNKSVYTTPWLRRWQCASTNPLL